MDILGTALSIALALGMLSAVALILAVIVGILGTIGGWIVDKVRYRRNK